MVKLHVILAQSEGGPEIDLVAGEVVARGTFSILTTTAVIRPNKLTIINLFLGRTNPQHADWLNAILPRIYVMNNNISADSLRAQMWTYNLCARRILTKWTYNLCARRILRKWTYNLCVL